MPRPRLPLLLGLALGSAVGGVIGASLVSFAARPAPSDPIINHPSSIINNWSWRDGTAPPRLADAGQTSAALAAWRDLRGADGGPADFTTRAAALRALLLRLPPASFPRVLDQLAASETPPDSDALLDTAFFAWLELDPASAARWAAARPDSRDRLSSALDAWSAADPRAAATFVCTLPDENLAGDLAYHILPALAEIDASAAVSLATARGKDFQQRLLPRVLGVLARRDPIGTVQTYGPLVWDGGQGLFQLRDALGAWANRDPAAAIAWVRAQPGRLDWDPSVNLAYIEVKPANRAAFAQALLEAPGFLRRDATLGGFLDQWADRDSAAVLAWLQKIPDAHIRATLTERTLGANTSGGDASRFLTFALTLPPGQNRHHQLTRILDKWAQNSPTDALRWVEAHAGDPGVAAASYAAHAAVLGVIARDDPAAAVAEWQKLPLGDAKTQGVSAIVAEWGQRDPAAALKWQIAQANPDHPVYPSQQMIYQWARKDAVSALRWVETLPAGMQKFGLFSLTNDGGNPTPPATALDLYAQIRDPALRAEFITDHASDWLVTDRPAATSWLEKSDALTPEQVAALLAPAAK